MVMSQLPTELVGLHGPRTSRSTLRGVCCVPVASSVSWAREKPAQKAK